MAGGGKSRARRPAALAAPAGPRVVVVANKTWEADPLVNVILSRARPPSFGQFEIVNYPVLAPGNGDEPRIEFSVAGARVEVWCVQDLMNPNTSSSSTAEKARVLPHVFSYQGRPRALAGDRVRHCRDSRPAVDERVGCDGDAGLHSFSLYPS